jgi:uncharacterized protein YaiL (DUF2058 family)
MSLRDALLQAGVVNKKAKKKTERELQQARKKSQSHLRRKKALQQDRDRAAESAKAAAQAERRIDRIRLMGQRAEAARALRTRQLIEHHHLRFDPGPVGFFHKDTAGRRVLRLRVPRKVADGLRKGRLGIVLHQSLYEEPQYRVLPRDIAKIIQELESSSVVFLPDLSTGPMLDPSLARLDELQDSPGGHRPNQSL